MIYGNPVAGGLGFSLNPLHYVKKAAHDVAHPISTVKSAASAAAHVAELPAKAVVHAVTSVMKLAFRPITSRIHTLENRRAGKIAYDKRKATTPTPAERAQAKSWTKSHLRSQGPQGALLSLFAGPPPMMPFMPAAGMLGQDPATVSVIAASIPIFTALMNSILHKASASGEAPAKPGDAPPASDPEAAAAAQAQAAGGGAAAGGDAGGGDAGAGGDAGGGGGGGGGHGGGSKILGMPKKYVIIGGAVLGGILVLSLLSSKKGQQS
jgi:uncharacterized membrane protein YgcG